MLTSDLIAAVASVGASGVVMFEGIAPNSADRAVVFNQYQGTPTPYVSGLREPSAQAMCRDKLYADAHDLAQAVHDALDALSDVTINGTRYLQIDARGEPQYMGQDAQQRHTFVVNFDTISVR